MERNLRQEAHSYPQADIDRYLFSPFTATSVTSNKMAGRHGAPRPPMTDVGTETASDSKNRKHFRKSKHLLRS